MSTISPINAKQTYVTGVKWTTNTHVGKNIKVSQHVKLTILPLTSPRTPRGSIWGKNKPNLPPPSLSPSAHSPPPDPWHQQDLRFYCNQQTPKPTNYLPTPNATFHTCLTWYLSSISGDLHHATRWRHRPSWAPHVFTARRNRKSSTSHPSSWPVYSLLVLLSLLWSNLVKKFIFQVPPQINQPFDQGESIHEIKKGHIFLSLGRFWGCQSL